MVKTPKKLTAESSTLGSQIKEVVPEISDTTSLLANIGQCGDEGSHSVAIVTDTDLSSEFDAQVDVVTRPEYGLSPQLVDRATLEWHKDGGKFFLQGQTTHLGLTIFGILTALGLVVCNGLPVKDSYIPIGAVAFVSLSIFVMDKNGVNKTAKK